MWFQWKNRKRENPDANLWLPISKLAERRPPKVYQRWVPWSVDKELSYCWDGCTMLDTSNFRYRVGRHILLCNALFLSNLWEHHHRSYSAENWMLWTTVWLNNWQIIKLVHYMIYVHNKLSSVHTFNAWLCQKLRFGLQRQLKLRPITHTEKYTDKRYYFYTSWNNMQCRKRHHVLLTAKTLERHPARRAEWLLEALTTDSNNHINKQLQHERSDG